MPQTLLKADKLTLQIEKTFVSGTEEAVYAMQAGVRVLLKEGRPGGVSVHMGPNLNFFYDDGTPLDNHAHIGPEMSSRMRVGNRIFIPADLAKKQVDEILAARESGEKTPKKRSHHKAKPQGGVNMIRAEVTKRFDKKQELRGSDILRQERPDSLHGPDRGEGHAAGSAKE